MAFAAQKGGWEDHHGLLETTVFVSTVILIPSGYVKIAIENDHRNSGFSH